MILDTSILLLAFISAVSYIVLRSFYRLYFHPLSQYPGPKLAAISHAYEFYYDIIKGGAFLFHIGKLHDQYGPIVRINPRELHIKDPSFYDEIYASSTRPRDKDPHFVNIFASPNAIVATTGHDHHRFRRGILNNLFSKRSVTELSPVIEERALKLTQRLEEAHHSDSNIVQLDLAFSGLTADVITRYAYGKSWGFLEDKEFRSSVRIAVYEATHAVHINRFCPLVWKILRRIPPQVLCFLQPGKASLFEFQSSIFEHSAQSMEQPHTQSEVLGEEEQKNKKAFMIFEKLTDPSLPLEERTLARLQDEALAFLVAGTETTARALTLAAFHLASDQTKWKRLREELETVMPTPLSRVTWTQVEQLPYLTGVVQEALRMSFGLIIRLPRIAPTEALKYGEYVIPLGTPVSMSTYFVNQDPAIFPDPESFNPDRWVKQTDRDRLSRYMVSFTKGSRACIGQNLAYAEMYLTIAYLVRRFDIELYNTTVDDIRVVREYGMGYTKRGDVEVLARITNVLT